MSATASDLLARLQAQVGVNETFAMSHPIGKAAMSAHARAIAGVWEDNNEQGAAAAPLLPTYVCETFRPFGDPIDASGLPKSAALEGLPPPLRAGNSYRFFNPVKPSDIVTARRKTERVWRKSGRSGELIFQRTVVTYVNQGGQTLATNAETLCYRV